MKPTASTLLSLLALFRRRLISHISSSTTAFLDFTIYLCFYKLIPAANIYIRLNISFSVFNFVFFEYLSKV